MNLSSLGNTALQVLKTIAPTLALAVGGPFGPIAAAAVHAALGTEGDDAKADAIMTAATPDQLLALKKADADFQTQMATLGVAREKLVYDDIANARARQVSLKDITPNVMAWFIVTASIALGAAAVLGYITKDPAQASLVGTVIGYVFGEAKEVLSYFFGSSSGSAAKSDTIDKIVTK